MKFTPYTSADDALYRDRLVMHATQSSPEAARSSLLIAPAGYGKTTLLCQIRKAMRSQGLATIWLNCTAEDRDPDIFLTNLSRAFAAASLSEGSIEYGADDLMETLAENGPAALLIDEYENSSSAGSDGILESLIRRLPAGCRIFVASRDLPKISLTKLILDRRMRIVDATELRFTDQEISSVISLPDLPASYGDLLEQSEGWPVMIQLARLDWQNSAGQGPSGTPRLGHTVGIFDYLAEQILNRLSSPLRDFLLELSVLTEVDMSSARAVTSCPDAEKAAYELLRLRPIVTVISEDPLAIRLHPLFRDFLRHERLNFPVTPTPELHRRAALHFAAQKDLPKAVHHAAQSGSEDLVVQILEDAGGALLNVSEGYSRSRSYLTELAPGTITARPRLHLMRIMQRGMEGTSADWLDEFDLFLQQLDEREEPELSRDEDLALLIDLVRGIGNISERRGVPVGAPWPGIAERRRKCLARKFAEPRYHGLSLVLELAMIVEYGSLQLADQRAQELAELFQSANFTPNYAWISNHSSYINLYKGNLSAAEYDSKLCLERVRSTGETRNTLMHQHSHAILGECYFEQNKLELALRMFDEIPRYVPYALLSTACGYLCTAARARLLLGESQRALTELRQGYDFARAHALPRLTTIAAATLAELHLSLGDADGCTRWIAEEELEEKLAGNEPWLNQPWLEVEALVRLFSRFRLCEGDIDDAHDLARGFAVRAEQGGRPLAAAHADVIVVEALMRKGQREQAQVVLRRIVNATAEHGALRPLLELSTDGVTLLRGMARRKGEAQGTWIDAVLEAMDSGAPNRSTAANDMTPRERDVLRGLKLGHSTKIIARDLCISHETVRHHLKKIYTKLEVHSRDEAVREALRRGALSS